MENVETIDEIVENFVVEKNNWVKFFNKEHETLGEETGLFLYYTTEFGEPMIGKLQEYFNIPNTADYIIKVVDLVETPGKNISARDIKIRFKHSNELYINARRFSDDNRFNFNSKLNAAYLSVKNKKKVI